MDLIDSSAANSRIGWLGLAYIALILAFGGGGSPAPLAELICQALAVGAVVAWFVWGGPAALGASQRIWWVLALIAIVPIVQLIPLPPMLWQLLPGRGLVQESLGLVGAADTWRPLSVAPQRTLEGLLSLLPPMVAMILVASLDRGQRRSVLIAIGAFALASVAVGAGQLASDGKGPLYLYTGAERGVLFGFQANRNAQVDVLLIGILATVAAWYRPGRMTRSGLVALAAVILVLLLGALLTGSRAGIGLVPLVLAWCVWFWRSGTTSDRSLRRIRILGLAAAAIAGLAFAALQTRALGRVLARFDFAGEYRPDIWRDTIHAIGQYWPLGSGIGTFTRTIGPSERLEAIGASLPNRAHNEYLELLLEGGLPLAFVWLAVSWMVGAALWKALRGGPPALIGQVMFAGGTLTVVTLHSLVDYPFRSMALASLIGVAAAIVLVSPVARSGTRSQ
jgi:O-antigen ligase